MSDPKPDSAAVLHVKKAIAELKGQLDEADYNPGSCNNQKQCRVQKLEIDQAELAGKLIEAQYRDTHPPETSEQKQLRLQPVRTKKRELEESLPKLL